MRWKPRCLAIRLVGSRDHHVGILREAETGNNPEYSIQLGFWEVRYALQSICCTLKDPVQRYTRLQGRLYTPLGQEERDD